jgi:hypothetical protein
MAQFIQFYFNGNDPLALSKTILINPGPTNFIEQTYFSYPLYDFLNIQVGYLAGNTIVQQISPELYEVKLISTYHFGNTGSITWEYAFLGNNTNNNYPEIIANAAPIVSSTGQYYSKTGIVSLRTLLNSRNEVTVKFITSL